MATGWLRGVVKEIVSGDTLVIAGNVKSGHPPEKRITLSSLVAPKLGRRDGSTPDASSAWALRELAALPASLYRHLCAHSIASIFLWGDMEAVRLLI
jgi:hypothetical protein